MIGVGLNLFSGQTTNSGCFMLDTIKEKPRLDLGKVNDQLTTVSVDLADMNVTDWVTENSAYLTHSMQKEGALLIRGLMMQGSKKLEKVLQTLFAEELLEYNFRTTPRTKMRGHIYTSTEYHQDQTILQHNENAYSNKWPMKIAFYCVKPAESGGNTPIADSRVIYQEVPSEIRSEFEAKKLLYVRNYADIDLPWSEVFQTTDKAQVESYCRANNIEFEWLENNRLRTKQVNAATCKHPLTQQPVWFNQAHMFHISSLNKETRESLLNVVGLDGLPKNVYFGDGSAIDDEVIAKIREVYQKYTFSFSWQEGDLMLLDNMLYTHGRQPFVGTRRVLTGMAGPMSHVQLEHSY